MHLPLMCSCTQDAKRTLAQAVEWYPHSSALQELLGRVLLLSNEAGDAVVKAVVHAGGIVDDDDGRNGTAMDEKYG